MATIADIQAARDDQDLRGRISTAAEALGLGAQWAQAQMGRLVAVTIDSAGDTTTLADVYAYAVAMYNPTPPPGANPAAATDAMIYAAINTVNGPLPEGS